MEKRKSGSREEEATGDKKNSRALLRSAEISLLLLYCDSTVTYGKQV